MKHILPSWFYNFFVLPYLLIIMVLIEAIHYKDSHLALTVEEQEQVFDKFYYLCVVLGILTAALCLYIIKHFLVSIVL
jgi:hypothetical protein